MLEQYLQVYLPQRDGGQVAEMIRQGIDSDKASRLVYEADVRAIRQCDVLIIILDGRAVDEGAAFELGLARALGKVCVGLRTDTRGPIFGGENAMIRSALDVLFFDPDDLVDWTSKFALQPEGAVAHLSREGRDATHG